MSHLPYLIFGVFATLIGVWLLVKAIRQMRLGQRSHAWPTVPGCVTHAAVESDYESEVVNVEYRYKVKGVEYSGDVLQTGHPAKSRAQNRALLDRYAVGTEVEVHYDSDDPSTAVLIPGGGSKIFASASSAVLLLGVGLYFTVTSIRPVLAPEGPKLAEALPDVPYFVLNDPGGVAVGADGTVYVCDGPPKQEWTPITPIEPLGPSTVPGFPGLPTTTRPMPGVPNAPSAQAGGRLIRMAPDLTDAKTEVPSTLLKAPSGLAIDDSGKMYVTDGGQLWVYSYSENKTLTGATPLRGSEAFNVAVDSGGTVYVTQSSSGRVLRLPAEDKTATEFFKAPDNGSATDVAVDSAGNVFVTDSRNSRVFLIAAGGGTSELPFQGISHPEGVAVDTAGNVYVVDAGNHRVMKLNTNSRAVTDLLLDGLRDPYDVAVDTAGNVLVTDRGSKFLLKFPRPQ